MFRRLSALFLVVLQLLLLSFPFVRWGEQVEVAGDFSWWLVT
jgi:hypothetical protein